MEMQRLTRRSILHDPKKLRQEFYTQFVRGLDEFYHASTGRSIDEFANDCIFEPSGFNIPPPQNAASSEMDEDEIVTRPSLALDDIIIFDEDEQLEVDDTDDVLHELLQDNLNHITIPRSLIAQKPSEPKKIIDKAIDEQTTNIKEVMCRYIVTEQNLLFERRCKDWMIVPVTSSCNLAILRSIRWQHFTFDIMISVVFALEYQYQTNEYLI